MPYIKKVEVTGFKTFGRKTTLLFDKGFTAITGPNGSGKTNIIDAVLFGLGELSARRLRTSNFSSLIFHGSPNPNIRKKNKAKVIVQFDNSDGRLPTETSTVTVSREIDQNGQSVYRINGRRVSRSYIIETLSIAGISPYGHNVILQGALTRVAEISPHERRKIIEDLIGIAQYDAEKTEAEEKLESANISIKTALGQVGEVQRRIESLERERNDLFRHNFIQNEIKRLEAVKLSHETKNAGEKISQLSSENRELGERIEKIRGQRENLRSKRHEIETEWRKLGFGEVEENQTRILETQIRIGELRSRLSELTTKMRAGKASLGGLVKVRENTSHQIESLRSEIKESKTRIKQLTAERDALLKEIAEEQSAYDAIYSEATQARSNLGEKNQRIREDEEQLDQLYQEAISLRSDHAGSKSKIKVYAERLKNLKDKGGDLNSSLDRLQESLKGLRDIRKEQMSQLRVLQSGLERRTGRKKILETEIKEAGKIAEIAREALVEFEARRELIEKIKTEETALKHIEELGELGIIQGIHGRLKSLIKTKKRYKHALEAAAAGWLNSLIVQDFDVAFTCVETLRQLKLGRIKIIPLQDLSPTNQVNQPRIDGIEDNVSAFVKHDKKYASAVSFVLGDTWLASDGKAALAASRKGFRSVTLSGDLYEAGGGVESGFYRTPVDFSSFVPSELALQNLDKAITVLKDNLSGRETDIGELENEIAETQEEIAKLAETLGKLESEIERTRKSIHQTKLNIDRAEKNLTKLQNLLEEETIQVELYRNKRDEIAEKQKKLQKELAGLKKQVGLSEIQEREQNLEGLGNEIIVLRKKVGGIETELSTLQSKMENVLKTSLENASIQRTKMSRQISVIKKEIEDSIKEKEESQEKIEELEKAKQDLSNSLLDAKGESKKFTSQIDDIDNQLQILEREYEQTDRLLDELRLNLQTFQLQRSRLMEQLRFLGYEEPLEVSSEQVQETEASLRLMRFELERIGAVNQLALTQYEEQVSRYKELSIRMNELEREKMAIVNFIEEIEQKKYKAFMEAFNQINERIDKYFSRLTDGGNAALELENPENPFAGGVDMVVQFLGKPPIPVNGASSGERSVSAVAFLFALQEFTPASFYLLDEIDAHLDAFHVERLGELLVQEADKSQFVVVTLKPEMVSKADRIYGVYGHEGVSQVVSTTFKGAAQ
jgi:chromosome segregation protein